MRLLVALNDNNGNDSKLSEHFGHCPFFGIVDTTVNKIEIIKNEIDHSNNNLTPVDQVMKHNPNSVFTLGIGQRAIKLFNEKHVELKTGKFSIFKEVIDNINNLDDLSSGCAH